jgi:hypothetical protein
MKTDKIVFKVSHYGLEHKAVLKEDASIDECLDAVENLLKAITYEDKTIAKGFKRKADQYE